MSVATATAVAASALVALGGAGVANAAAYPTINEFSASTTGTDVEYVEVHAAPGTDLSAFRVLSIEGDASGTATGTLDRVITLGTTNADGLYLATLPADALENGTMTLLLVEGAVPATGTDLDTNDDGVLDVALTVVDGVSVHDGGAADLTYAEVRLGVSYDGAPFAPGGASRVPDGTDTNTQADWVRNAFSRAGAPGFETLLPAGGEAYNTPGAPNRVAEAPAIEPLTCGTDGVVLIGDAQGPGDASPIVGSQVEVEGVVTAVQPGLSGFVVQEEDADQDDLVTTSEAIFVFDAAALVDVAVGDAVRVGGAVSEFRGLTEITIDGFGLCEQDVALPATTEVAIPLQAPESLESMLVAIPQTLSVIETFEYARFGTIVLGTDRQLQPTAIHAPGSQAAIDLAAANLANRIVLDDVRAQQNPDPAIHPNGEAFTLANTFRGGDDVTNVTGVLDWRADTAETDPVWRIQPTQGADHEATNPRPEVPVVDGDLQVASFNVLNYFTTLDSRGANTAEEFDRQEAKIVAAILELDADIVGLLEIENNDGVALDTLVAALNEAAAEPRYAAIDTGVVGTDEITTAVIYQPASVTPQGAFAVLDSTVDPRFDTTRNRPSIAQTFATNDTGALLTVSVNHLKSKGSACAGDPDLGDGAGNCNLTRTNAAAALADWLAGDPTQAGTDNVLILGDLNSYDHEAPIVALESAGYVDQLERFQGEEAYTYVFDGQLGYLDYALAGPGLGDQVVDAAAWTANSDEVPILDYDMTFKQPAQDALYAPDPYRASDHDAVLVGLDLEAPVVPGVEVTTFAGADRYEANAAASAALFAPGSDVYLASGAIFTDALSAGPAAAHDDASLLLTTRDALLGSTLAELDRLDPPSITIVGGEATVSPAVLDALVARFPDAEVRRIAGADRFEVAAAVATEVFGSAERAFVASGLIFSDALSASGVAATLGDVPVLLSTPDSVPTATLDALESLGTTQVTVVGGRATLGDRVLGTLRTEVDSAQRVAGADRYATNAAIVERFLEPTDPQAIVVASGVVFSDALSATAAAGATGGPLLLSPGQCTTLDVADIVSELDPELVLNVGGPATLSPQAWQTPC
ncbi:ExeM/NucH family extracellular endonuclease [Agrococcus versicolor]|uniref:ExeM/NucH family extracellular endonuclease n=1 Tax=Agrococcus versicolor TaxID=501482 RepID=UPI0031D9EC7C